MTQQEVADRLCVSNKAVSRWERDECAPDLSLIPELAEMFGVTCDELLRGERITQAESAEPASKQKSERALRTFVRRAETKFKNLIYIALALAGVGLVAMLGISYGFYRAPIGFAVMLLFALSSVVVTAIAVNRLKDQLYSEELIGEEGSRMADSLTKTLSKFSFTAYFAVAAAIVAALPLVIAKTGFVQSVLSLEDYLQILLLIVLPVLALIWLKGKGLYTDLATGIKAERMLSPKAFNTGIFQIILCICSAGFFLIAGALSGGDGYTALCIAGLACAVANAAVFVGALVNKTYTYGVTLVYGIRNLLYSVAAVASSSTYTILYKPSFSIDGYTSSTYWDLSILALVVIATVWATLIFEIIAKAVYKHTK